MLPCHSIATLTLLTAHPTRPLPINQRLVLPRNPANKSLRRIACVTVADLVHPRQLTSLLREAKQVLKTRRPVEVIIRMKLAMAADAAHSFHQILPNTTSVDIHMMRHTCPTVNLLFHRDPLTTHPMGRIHCCGQGRDPRYLSLLVQVPYGMAAQCNFATMFSSLRLTTLSIPCLNLQLQSRI
jgi:hypothetical protein